VLEGDALLSDDTGRGAACAWTGGSGLGSGTTETGRCRVTIVGLGGGAHYMASQ